VLVLALFCCGCFSSKTALLTRANADPLPVKPGTWYGTRAEKVDADTQSATFVVEHRPARDDPHRYRYADIPDPGKSPAWWDLRVRRLEGDFYLAQLVQDPADGYLYQYVQVSRDGLVLLDAAEETQRVVAGSVGIGWDKGEITGSAAAGWRFASQVAQLEIPGNWKRRLAKDTVQDRFLRMR